MEKIKNRMNFLLAAKLVAVILATSVSFAVAQVATAVPALDVNRFTATWYEIARLPDKAEKSCVRDGLVLFASGTNESRLGEVSSCALKSGFAQVNNKSLRFANKKVHDGHLKVSYLLPFLLYRKQWLLALGPNYEWALVGSPNHKSLWILSATPKLAPEVLADIEGRATAQGFNLSKLILVPQTDPQRRVATPNAAVAGATAP